MVSLVMVSIVFPKLLMSVPLARLSVMKMQSVSIWSMVMTVDVRSIILETATSVILFQSMSVLEVHTTVPLTPNVLIKTGASSASVTRDMKAMG